MAATAHLAGEYQIIADEYQIIYMGRLSKFLIGIDDINIRLKDLQVPIITYYTTNEVCIITMYLPERHVMHLRKYVVEDEEAAEIEIKRVHTNIEGLIEERDMAK